MSVKPDRSYSRTTLAQPCRGEDVDRAIALLAQTGGDHYVPLFRAVRAGVIAFIPFTHRRQAWRVPKIPRGLPILALIGDDDLQSTGPSGWRAARGVCSWAQYALVHAAAAAPEHYASAVLAAIIHKRALLIETATARYREWVAALPRPAAVLLPSEGQHPVMPAREALQ